MFKTREEAQEALDKSLKRLSESVEIDPTEFDDGHDSALHRSINELRKKNGVGTLPPTSDDSALIELHKTLRRMVEGAKTAHP